MTVWLKVRWFRLLIIEIANADDVNDSGFYSNSCSGCSIIKDPSGFPEIQCTCGDGGGGYVLTTYELSESTNHKSWSSAANVTCCKDYCIGNENGVMTC